MSQEKMTTVATDLASLPSDAAQQAAAKANNTKPYKAKVQKPKAEAQQPQAQPQQQPQQAAVAAPPAPPAQQTPLTLESLEKRVSALEGDMGGVKVQLNTQAAQLDAIQQAASDSTQKVLVAIGQMRNDVRGQIADVKTVLDARIAAHERYSGLFGWARRAWDGLMVARAVEEHNDDVIDAAKAGKNPTLNQQAEAEAKEAEEARAKAVAEANAKQDKKRKAQACEETAAATA